MILFRFVAFIVVRLIDAVEYYIAVIGLSSQGILKQKAEFKIIYW